MAPERPPPLHHLHRSAPHAAHARRGEIEVPRHQSEPAAVHQHALRRTGSSQQVRWRHRLQRNDSCHRLARHDVLSTRNHLNEKACTSQWRGHALEHAVENGTALGALLPVDEDVKGTVQHCFSAGYTVRCRRTERRSEDREQEPAAHSQAGPRSNRRHGRWLERHSVCHSELSSRCTVGANSHRHVGPAAHG